MKINKDSLKARANNLSNKLGISQNVIYDRFFFDAFLARLSISPYKNNFVLKGGLYLSSVLGIDSRSTMDINYSFEISQKCSKANANIIMYYRGIWLYETYYQRKLFEKD